MNGGISEFFRLGTGGIDMKLNLRLPDLPGWHVSSQVGARRNALAASIELARSRQELDDVTTFLASRPPKVPGAGGPRTAIRARAAEQALDKARTFL